MIPWLFLVLSLGTEANCSPKVKVVPAAHLIEVPDVTVYESSVKLLFRTPMPIIPRKGQTERGKGFQEVVNVTELIIDDLEDELFQRIPNPFEPSSKSKRVKRGDLELVLGLGGGLAIGSVLTRAWDTFFGHDDQVQDYVTKLRSNVVDIHKDLVLTESKIEEYSLKVATEFKDMKAATSEEFEEVLHGFLLKIQRDWYVESKFACMLRVIPNKLIKQETLYTELNKLNLRLARYNKTLAIPVKDISRYYKIPIADCMFTPTQMVVVINVPIIRVGNDWQLFEMVHTKFAYNKQTCSIYPQEANFLATCSSKSVLITNSYLRHCDIHTHGICLVPEYTKDSSESLSCAIGLLKQKPVSELQHYCAFRCSSNSELMVQELHEGTVVLTNAEYLEVNCRDGYRNFTFKKEGAVHVQLKCNCTMLVDNHYLIDSPIFCYPPTESGDSIYRVSPNLWSKLDTALASTSLYFHEHTNLTLNPDWFKAVPVLNLTHQNAVVIPELPVFESGHLKYTDIWLMILSVLFLTEFWISIHIFRAYMNPSNV